MLNSLNPYRFNNLGLRTLAGLLLVGAWVLIVILNGITAFSGGRDLFDGMFRIVFNGLVSAGLYILVISLGFKRPVIAGLILLFVTATGILAMPSLFFDELPMNGGMVALVLFVIFLLVQAAAAMLYFLSVRTEKGAVESVESIRLSD